MYQTQMMKYDKLIVSYKASYDFTFFTMIGGSGEGFLFLFAGFADFGHTLAFAVVNIDRRIVFYLCLFLCLSHSVSPANSS